MTVLATACTGVDDPEPGQGAQCELDSCVSADSGTDSSLECCLATHGRGLEGDDLAELRQQCDDCDPASYLSAGAAVCAAQVCGLDPGVGTCSAAFNFGADRATWTVRSHEESCEAGANLCGGGTMVEVEATTGACLGKGAWAN